MNFHENNFPSVERRVELVMLLVCVGSSGTGETGSSSLPVDIEANAAECRVSVQQSAFF